MGSLTTLCWKEQSRSGNRVGSGASTKSISSFASSTTQVSLIV